MKLLNVLFIFELIQLICCINDINFTNLFNNNNTIDSNVDLSLDKCTICRSVVEVMHTALKFDKAKSLVADGVNSICKLLKIETNEVCRGATNEFKGEMLYVLNELIMQPLQLCNVLVSNCGERYSNHDVPWFVTFPNSTKPPFHQLNYPDPDNQKLRILQLTDIHLDLQYAEHSEATCNEPLCCRKRSNEKPKEAAGHWGFVGACDTPIRTLVALFEHLNETSDNFDVIYWTGDLPPHNIWNQTKRGQIQILAYLAELFQLYLPTKPVYAAIGNHEGAPVNSFPPTSWTSTGYIPSQYSVSWLYDSLAKDWSKWDTNGENENLIQRFASYATEISPGFIIISLNTNYCNDQNWWLRLNSTDPDGELQWLVDQLQSAENINSKVHIIGHIPTGIDDCMKWWSFNYYAIVNRYENTIRGQFFGHTHFDSFYVFFDGASPSNRISNVAFVGPSVTPFPNHNPAYRIYIVDAKGKNATFGVLDHETYYLDLAYANRWPDQKPIFNLEYTAKDTYGIKSLFPDDVMLLINKLKDPWQPLYLELYKRFYRTSSQWNCDDSCRAGLICEIMSGNSHNKQHWCQ